MSSEFHTVGQLRALLEGVPDGLPLLCQVVATNGQAWNLVAQFNAKTPGNFALLQMKHEELTSLQWPAQETRAATETSERLTRPCQRCGTVVPTTRIGLVASVFYCSIECAD